MTKDKKIISELNPSLKIIRDNKPKWYLPETRREGYRNLHKINRYGLLLRSDHVLKLNQKYNDKIEKIPSVNKMINHKYFCSLLVGKDQDILYEKYADDKTPADLRNIGIRPDSNAAVDPNMELSPDQIPLEDPLADPLNTDAGVVPQGGTPPGSPESL